MLHIYTEKYCVEHIKYTRHITPQIVDFYICRFILVAMVLEYVVVELYSARYIWGMHAAICAARVTETTRATIYVQSIDAREARREHNHFDQMLCRNCRMLAALLPARARPAKVPRPPVASSDVGWTVLGLTIERHDRHHRGFRARTVCVRRCVTITGPTYDDERSIWMCVYVYIVHCPTHIFGLRASV